MAGSRPIPGWALAPFGRIGHALGWRWVFFFTFPIPFHPWLARALPFLIGAWFVWLALGPEEVAWTAPIWVALVLGGLLSIPILQWILFAFRLHLIQALMLPATLVLLGVAAVKGDVALGFVAVPILCFAAQLPMALTGRLRIRAWQASNREVEALGRESGPLPPLLIRSEQYAQGHAMRLLDRLELAAIHYSDRTGTKQALRVDDPELILWLAEVQDMRLDLFQMPKGQKHRFLFLPDDPPEDAWAIEHVQAAPLRFLHGQVAGVRAEGPGRAPITYWHGTPAPLSWFPAFYFFIRLILGQPAGFKAEVGLLPGKPRSLGKFTGEEGAYGAVASALRLDGPAPPPFADPAQLRRRVQASVDRRLEPDLSALDRLIADPATWMDRKLDLLLRLPHLYAHRAADLVEALRVARDAKHPPSAILLARLIAALPEAAYRGVGEQLLTVLNSKSLAGRMVYDDVAPDQPPPFEGFRLLTHVPRLYERLGELGEPARKVVEGLLKLLPHIEALQRAKARLDGTASDAQS